MSARKLLLSFALTLLPLSSGSQTPQPTATSSSFESVAQTALATMRSRAEELKVGGVAMVALIPGDSFQSWTSRALAVSRYKDLPTETSKGSNLLAIVYGKAAEMADTLKDSGAAGRPPMTGEFGWQGGVIIRGRSGYLLAAFSGGKSEDDVTIAHAGLAALEHGNL